MPSKELTSPLDRNGLQDLFKFGGGADVITVIDGPIGYLIDSGGGDDTVTGSVNGDAIAGGDGNDMITGGGGADLIYGGDGDVVNGGAPTGAEKVGKNGGPSANTIYGDYFAVDLRDGGYEGPLVTDPSSPFFDQVGLNGGDTIYGGDHASNTIYGDAFNVLLGDGALFIGSDDTIYGGDGDGVNNTIQTIYADTNAINSNGDGTFQGGADIVIGGDNTTNTVYGDFVTTTAAGVLTFIGGADTLTGGDGSANTLYGDGERFANTGSFLGGNDVLTGGANGTNTLYGDVFQFDAYSGVEGTFTGGADTLIGGENASDWMYGDYSISASDAAASAVGGADTFVIGLNGGEDHIMDFRQADLDQVDLSAYGFTGIGELDSLWFSDNGALALDLGGGTVTFENIAWTDGELIPLVDGDFIF